MTAFMMYMSGNGLQIFSIMMVFMAFKNPIMGLMATNQAFTRFESEGTKSQLLMVKAVYVGMQILALALGIWKVNGMGKSFPSPLEILIADFLLQGCYRKFLSAEADEMMLADIFSLGQRDRIGWLGRRKECLQNMLYLGFRVMIHPLTILLLFVLQQIC